MMSETYFADLTGILRFLFWSSEVFVYIFCGLICGSKRPGKDEKGGISHETMLHHMELVRKMEETFARQQQLEQAAARDVCTVRQPPSGPILVSPYSSDRNDGRGIIIPIPPVHNDSTVRSDAQALSLKEQSEMIDSAAHQALVVAGEPVAAPAPIFFGAIGEEGDITAVAREESVLVIACSRKSEDVGRDTLDPSRATKGKRQLPASSEIDDDTEPPKKKLCTNG
jgi:hypothetical protein